MKLTEQEENGKWYDVAVHTVSKMKFRKLFEQDGSYVEIPLNDHAMEMRATKLPYSPEINTLVQRAIDIGAELLWIKKGK